MNKFFNVLYTSIPIIYIFILLFQIDLGLLEDLGRHLKMGEVILQCRCVPSTNLFSYTNTNFPVINHEWLTQIFLFLTFKYFGLNGLLILKFILVLLSFLIVFYVSKKKSSYFWLCVFSIVLITIFSSRFRVRPELFSYFFISLFLLLINLFENKKIDKRLLLILPFIQMLWVNMHIFFIFGIIIFAGFIIQDYFSTKKINNFFIMVFTFIILVNLINPNHVHAVLLPFTFQSNYGISVEENMSIFDVGKYAPSFLYTLMMQILIFEFLSFIFFITFLILFKKNQIKDIINTLISIFLGFKFVRSISLFGLLGLPILTQKFTDIEDKLNKKIDRYTISTIKGVIFLSAMLFGLIFLSGLKDNNVLRFGFETYSENAVNFINSNNLEGPIFNNYHIGNYLIFGLFPREKVFVDARPEMYDKKFLDSYQMMLKDENLFNIKSEEYKINLIVIGVNMEDPQTIRPFVLRIIKNRNWVPIFADGNVTIFIRNSEKNKNIIDKYKISV